MKIMIADGREGTVGRSIKKYCGPRKYNFVSFLLYEMAPYQHFKTKFTILTKFLVIMSCLCMHGPLLQSLLLTYLYAASAVNRDRKLVYFVRITHTIIIIRMYTLLSSFNGRWTIESILNLRWQTQECNTGVYVGGKTTGTMCWLSSLPINFWHSFVWFKLLSLSPNTPTLHLL